MKRHRSPSGSAAIPRPAGRAGPRGAAIGASGIMFAAALLATACSSSGAGPQVASLGGQHGSGAAQHPLTTAQGDRDMVNFARCMRAHGVAMPDPVHQPGHTGLTL